MELYPRATLYYVKTITKFWKKNIDPDRKDRSMHKNAEKLLANILSAFDRFLLLEENFD